MNNNDNNKQSFKQKAIKLADYIKSIAKTFSGTGWIPDWIKTAKVLIPLIFIVIFINAILIYTIVMAPSAAIQDKIHSLTNIAANIGDWFNKLGNFLSGNGWVDDDEKYTNKLEKKYNEYEKKGICLDDTLINATLTYKYIISNNPDASDELDLEEISDDNADYDEMTRKISTLAKRQTYNNSISNADYLAYLRTGDNATDEERSKMNKSSSNSLVSTPSNGGIFQLQKYDLSDEQIRSIATLCENEQGTVEGAKAEASLMANRFELYGSAFGTGSDGLYNYIKSSGWWHDSNNVMENSSSANQDIFNAVKSVLVDGNRTLPNYIDEHDCIDCGSVGFDIIKIVTGDTTITTDNTSELKNHSNYVKDQTIIHNKYGGAYTFYSFPTENSDPFGYTSEAKQKASSLASESETSSNSNDVSDITSDLPSSTPIQTNIIELPDGLGKVHTWTGWFDWNWKYGPGDVIKTLGTTSKNLGGYVGENDLGFITYGQWYAGATTSTFGKPGDMLFVVQNDGSIFPLIIADEKSQNVVAWDSNPANKWGHLDGKCVVEFETGQKWNRSIGECSLVQPAFNHTITKIVNVGSIYDTPQYIDNVEQALADANLVGSTFIDVGSVVTQGNNANSLLGNASSATCPGDLEYYRPTNEEIESANYKGGFIYKYYKNEFKNYNDTELNYAVENMIREIYYYKNSLTSVMETTTASSAKNGLKCSISGDFESWLQYDPKWGNIHLGNSSHTISSAGCMVTSIAIQIMKSGTQLLVNDFNPGVFVKTLNANGGFQGALFANNPNSWKSIAPNFDEIESNVPLTGTREEKTQKLKELLDQNYYVILTVKPNQGHWVALDRIEDNTVYIMDPASNSTKLWDEIYEVENTNTYTTFKAIDSASNPISSSGVCASASGDYKYYNQAPGDGSDGVHYGSYVVPCRGVTLNSVGCSQMSLAIIASGLVSPDITPITVADAYCDVGINDAVSISDVVQESLMQKLSMTATKLFDEGESRDSKKQKLQDILNKGYPVLINVTDHFVAVVPGEGGKIKLMDPEAQEKTKDYTMEEFDNVVWNGNNIWRSAYYFSKRS